MIDDSGAGSARAVPAGAKYAATCGAIAVALCLTLGLSPARAQECRWPMRIELKTPRSTMATGNIATLEPDPFGDLIDPSDVTLQVTLSPDADDPELVGFAVVADIDLSALSSRYPDFVRASPEFREIDGMNRCEEKFDDYAFPIDVQDGRLRAQFNFRAERNTCINDRKFMKYWGGRVQNSFIIAPAVRDGQVLLEVTETTSSLRTSPEQDFLLHAIGTALFSPVGAELARQLQSSVVDRIRQEIDAGLRGRTLATLTPATNDLFAKYDIRFSEARFVAGIAGQPVLRLQGRGAKTERSATACGLVRALAPDRMTDVTSGRDLRITLVATSFARSEGVQVSSRLVPGTLKEEVSVITRADRIGGANWVEYDLDIGAGGEYRLFLMHQTPETRTVDVRVNGALAGLLSPTRPPASCPPRGSCLRWEFVSILALRPGRNVLRIDASHDQLPPIVALQLRAAP
jgi:hypothetical protein